jgi:hypothetical protein
MRPNRSIVRVPTKDRPAVNPTVRMPSCGDGPRRGTIRPDCGRRSARFAPEHLSLRNLRAQVIEIRSYCEAFAVGTFACAALSATVFSAARPRSKSPPTSLSISMKSEAALAPKLL